MRNKFFFAFAFLVTLASSPVIAQESDKNVSRVIRLYESIRESIGYLGIQPQEVTKENFAKYGLSSVRGVAIEKVAENSPAAQAGLKAGDVIIQFNGEEVTSVRKLRRLIFEVAPDHQVRIKVLREGKEREFVVTMGKGPAPEIIGVQIPKLPEFKLPELPNLKLPETEIPLLLKRMSKDSTISWLAINSRIGIQVIPLTAQLAEYFGIDKGGGFLIASVEPNSPAEKAGLKAGDVIIEVDGKRLTSPFDLISSISAKREGIVNLTIIRDRNKQVVSVTLDEPEKDQQFSPDFMFDRTIL